MKLKCVSMKRMGGLSHKGAVLKLSSFFERGSWEHKQGESALIIWFKIVFIIFSVMKQHCATFFTVK